MFEIIEYTQKGINERKLRINQRTHVNPRNL